MTPDVTLPAVSTDFCLNIKSRVSHFIDALLGSERVSGGLRVPEKPKAWRILCKAPRMLSGPQKSPEHTLR